MSVYDGNGNVVDLGVQWSDIHNKDSVDSAVEQMQDIGGAFRILPAIYDPSKILPFDGDGFYSAYPFAPDTAFAPLTLYDANMNFVHVYNSSGTEVTHKTIGRWSPSRRAHLIFDGLNVTAEIYINWGEWENRLPHDVEYYTLSAIPAYIKTGRSFNVTFTEEVDNPYDMRWFFLNDQKYLGFLGQMNDFVQSDIVSRFSDHGEYAQRAKVYAVREMNAARSAMRIGTFNVYSAGYAQRNWDALKNMLFDFGFDIIAFQEVRDPLNTAGNNRVWLDDMTSWMLPYGSSNGELYPTNERVALSRYPVVSSSEYEFDVWSSDRRCLAKYEIQLPRYQDRVGSEQLKMSVYNTQLEVYPVGDTYEANLPNPTPPANGRISEVNQILADIAVDPNPFIVVCMDSNDFSPNKETWAMIEAAGFTHAISIKTQTVTDRDNCIDQIFVCARMRVLDYNVVNSNDYQFYQVNSLGMVPVSDHDLCYADVALDYSGIFCIKQVLTGVTSDNDAVWGEIGDSLTIHLAPESGKTFTKVAVRMGPDGVKPLYYSNGTITIPEVTGDVYIIATAE